MAFSFVHAADLHLDSPFLGVTAESVEISKSLQLATFEAFNSLVDLCIDNQVQFLLISGDVYDGADRSLRAQLRFRDGLQKLVDNEIQVFVVHGNHDPHKDHSKSIDWPKGVHVFDYRKVEEVIVTMEDVPIAKIFGISHGKRNESDNLSKKFEAANSDLFQIGVLHCNIGNNTGHDAYAPCELNDLLDAGIDYWALGHIHEKKVFHKTPHIVYPGNTQGRNIREKNERGCYLVNVDTPHKSVELEFCELDAIRWLGSSVTIEGLTTIDQLEESLFSCVDGLIRKANSRPVVCRISITGQGPLYTELRKDEGLLGLLQHLRDLCGDKTPFVWVQDLIFDCRPEIDVEKRMEQHDFLGQVLQVSRELSKSKSGIQLLQDNALSELFENRRAAKYLHSLTDKEIEQMRIAAELLCIQLLEKES